MLDRIYPPDSRDLILTATIKDSAESTLSINASLVDALMEEGQQQQNNNKEVDKATKSDGNLEGALKNTQNGSPNDAANKDQQGNNTATGGAGKDNPNGNGNNGGRCNKNDTCKKKKCKKAKKLNGDDDEDEDADKEECDTKCIKKNPCILSKENMEKKVSDMTNNFLHKLNCAGYIICNNTM